MCGILLFIEWEMDLLDLGFRAVVAVVAFQHDLFPSPTLIALDLERARTCTFTEVINPVHPILVDQVMVNNVGNRESQSVEEVAYWAIKLDLKCLVVLNDQAVTDQRRDLLPEFL